MEGILYLSYYGVFRFVTLPLEIVNSIEKRVHPRKFCRIVVYTLFLWLGNFNKAKNQDPWKFHMIFS